MNEENNQNEELEFNKKNREDYEKLMEESSTNKDSYWDINNPIVKAILLFIGLVIVVGSIYYIFKYINH